MITEIKTYKTYDKKEFSTLQAAERHVVDQVCIMLHKKLVESVPSSHYSNTVLLVDSMFKDYGELLELIGTIESMI